MDSQGVDINESLNKKTGELRAGLICVVSILELFIIIGSVVALCVYVKLFRLIAYAIEIICAVKIIASNDNPDYKLPWLFFVLVLPIVGFMLYFIFYSRKLSVKFQHRLKKLKETDYQINDAEILSSLFESNELAFNQVKTLIVLAETHAFNNTAVKYFSSADLMKNSLINDLNNAKKFIFMEYFIIKDGVFWGEILNVLKERADSGVDVRVLYDDIGCVNKLPANYYKYLRTLGIKALPFSPFKIALDGEFNNRNHRKITVIDGVIGYTGGVNFSDEYINVTKPFGEWKDSAIRLNGQAVYELTKLFLIDYGINLKEQFDIDISMYPPCKRTAKGIVVPFGDGPKPLYKNRVGKTAIKNLLYSACEYVYITTPYLIVDNDVLECIENTAKRGVEVKIILPHIPDKKLIYKTGRSFYSRLIKAGVKIYEYEKGFIHAKNYTVDGKYAIIGTINLDYRSLVHHFENGVFMYDTDCICNIEKDFNNTLKDCIRIEEGRLTFIEHVTCSVIRIVAPLL